MSDKKAYEFDLCAEDSFTVTMYLDTTEAALMWRFVQLCKKHEHDGYVPGIIMRRVKEQ